MATQHAKVTLTLEESPAGWLVSVCVEANGRTVEHSFQPIPDWHDALNIAGLAVASMRDAEDPRSFSGT